MSEEKTSEETKSELTAEEYVIIRSYSKIIFFYPLFLTSLVLGVIQLFYDETLAILGFIWMIVFFINLFVTAFNISSTKFFVLVLAIIIVILLLVFFVLPNVAFTIFIPPGEFNIEMTMQFYFITAAILGFMLLLAFLETRINFWKLERNELYHEQGIFAEADRYPVRDLRFKKNIPDVFEYLILRAGSITLQTGEETFHLDTVPNVTDKEDKIDRLLSHLSVEVDEVDK
ncbi:MAG: hypothetical protein GF311_19720 [Candidatus Lokiarchaeota archaeon]|jgi:hypothetical protein|nr:hypothetical protein [Candidatus Lokiarchaeota archaeon]